MSKSKSNLLTQNNNKQTTKAQMDRQSPSSPSPSPPPGGKQVRMQTSMKTVNGKTVTVTERVYEMPDGTIQTRVEKDVAQDATTFAMPKRTSTTTSSSSGGYYPNSRPSATSSSSGGYFPDKKPTSTSSSSGGFHPKTSPSTTGSSSSCGYYPKANPSTTSTSSSSGYYPASTPSTTTISSSSGGSFPQAKPATTTSGERSSFITTPHVKTEIVNGILETTTVYPDGRTETTSEPINQSTSIPSNSSFGTSGMKTKIPMTNQGVDCSNQVRVTTEIVNGVKETTTHYPDGRTETTCEVLSSGTPGSPPRRRSNATPNRTETSTRIVNGMKETTIRHPDGRTETRTEMMSPRSTTRTSTTTTTTSSNRPRGKSTTSSSGTFGSFPNDIDSTVMMTSPSRVSCQVGSVGK